MKQIKNQRYKPLFFASAMYQQRLWIRSNLLRLWNYPELGLTITVTRKTHDKFRTHGDFAIHLNRGIVAL